MKALAPSPCAPSSHSLLPGMFVRARIDEGVDPQAILVPQQGVTRTPRGDATVMLVNDHSQVETRDVIASQAIGNRWLITRGLQKVHPGTTVKATEDTVTQVIEQNMNGIDNLMYMSSTSDSAGGVTITLTFRSGTDPDIAQIQVQNKLQLATLLLQEVQQQGISVEKSSSSFLLVAGFISDNPDTAQDDISDYIASNVKEFD